MTVYSVLILALVASCHVYFRCLYISSRARTLHASSRFRHCLLRFRSSSLPTPRPRGLGPDYYYYDFYDITSGDEAGMGDQFVFSLVPSVIQDLLSEEDYNITFSDAVKKASDLELELERIGSRSLLVVDWLGPQSKTTSDPLAVDNPATDFNCPSLLSLLITPNQCSPDLTPRVMCPNLSNRTKLVVRRVRYYSSFRATTTAHARCDVLPRLK